ncbi:hypothetical protein [Agromyces humatus]|uniref:Uncharacterized protein n=1 Tax=Agromyces humatus TaxID=279573 RepID=A0ABP4WXT5_9MICO|nr:hypothetical protein [Agromyces humatus]
MTAASTVAVRSSIRPTAVGEALGVALVIAGGLVAAVAGPLQLERGSWLAAYLVLVCGVAQCLVFRSFAHVGWANGRRGWGALAAWNAGNLLVMVGALARLPLVADVGGLLLVVPLVAALRATFATPPASRVSAGRSTRVLARLVLAAVLIGVPVGLVLTHLRSAG